MSDLIDRQAAIDEIDEWVKAFLENGHKESAADVRLIQDGIIQLPSAQPATIYGYNVEHLVLIANTMKEKGISPEEAIDLFNDVSEIVGLVIDEMTRISEKALERAMGNDV